MRIPHNIGDIKEIKLDINGKIYKFFKITIANKIVVRGNTQDINKVLILRNVSFI